MPKYAVTMVAYIECDDEESAKHTADELIHYEYLYKNRGEFVDIVEVSEVEF